MNKDNQKTRETKIAIRTHYGVMVSASLMLSISTIALTVSWGLLAILFFPQRQIVRIALVSEGTTSDSGTGAGVVTLPPPRIFYSDITSGPKTGGQDDQGAFVTIYGKRFGSSRGTSKVTVGGQDAYQYLKWEDNKITFQIGQRAVNGPIAVVREGGVISNNLSFTIRSGRIFFVSSNGNNNNNGSFEAPWLSLREGKKRLQPGDILYIKDDLTLTNRESREAALVIASATGAKHGTAQEPIALIVMPDVRATIGRGGTCVASDTNNTCNTYPKYGFRTFLDHWVIAGFTAKGNLPSDIDPDHWGSSGIEILSSDIRLVANTVFDGYYGINMPNSNYEDTTHKRNNIKILGNHVFGTRNSTIYDGGFPRNNPTGREFAWNIVHGNRRGYGIKLLAHKPDDTVDQVSIHDNVIYNIAFAGIQLGNYTYESSEGHIPYINHAEVYNNIVFRSGRNEEAACFLSTGEAAMDLILRHNTFIDCGSSSDDAAILYFGDFESFVIENNIFVQHHGWPFFRRWRHDNSNSRDPELRNNIFYGSGTKPDYGSVKINANPQFLSYSETAVYNDVDLHLLPSSPAKDAGLSSSVTHDLDGIIRPQGSKPDLGAYEYFDQSSIPQPLFFRGNADGSLDNVTSINDAVYTLRFLFIDGPGPFCMDAADADDNGLVNLTDAVYTLRFLFQGGPWLLPPGPFQAGADPTPDTLGCAVAQGLLGGAAGSISTTVGFSDCEFLRQLELSFNVSLLPLVPACQAFFPQPSPTVYPSASPTGFSE